MSSVEALFSNLPPPKYRQIIRGYEEFTARGLVKTQFEVFNKTGEVSLDPGRPRLIWSPHVTLKYVMGVVNKLWLRTFHNIPWFTSCDTPERLLEKLRYTDSPDVQYISIDGSSFDST